MARNRRVKFQRGNISGVDEAVQNLRAIGEDVLFAAELALAEGADRIVNDAKRRCPVRTGRLRDSIKAVDIADGAAYQISADARNDVGIPYGQFVEFSPKINKPFLYPAIDANIKFIRNDIKFAIQDAISARSGYGYRAA